MKREIYSGVYMIHCNQNGKIYIGSSKDVEDRIWDHKCYLRGGYEEASSRLQEDWNIYGEECFTFSTVEKCEEEIMIDREDYWVRFYKTTKELKGYNYFFPKSKKADTEEGANRSYHYYKKSPVIVINKSTGGITECLNNLRAGELTSVPSDDISEYCRYWEGIKTRGMSCYGFIFVRKETYDPEFDYINYKPIYKRGAVAKPKPEKVLKPIADYNVKRVPVIAEHCVTGEQKHFRSRAECCSELNVSLSKLHKCLNTEFKKYKSKEHYFKFA